MRANYKTLMTLPAARKKTSRDELEKIAIASFDASDPYKLDSAPNCQFTEVGTLVIDPEAPLGCMFPPFRPTDKKARVIAVDDETGFVVTAAVIRGTVYPYPWRGHLMSAFIPDDMKEPQKIQDDWIARKKKASKTGLLAPAAATAEVMQVIQVYDGKMHASQINVYLGGPVGHSDWVR